MKVSFERTVGPEYMTGAMRTTRGKDMYKKRKPSVDTWYKMLLSSHSSARSVRYRIYIENIPYYIHVHYVRHHEGFEPHVFSQRDDDCVLEVSNRNDKSQDALIQMLADVNPMSILHLARERLCYKAHRVAQQVMEKLKCALIYEGDAYDRVLGNLMMRKCSWWRGYCNEPQPCGRIVGVKTLASIHKDALEIER